MRDDIQRERDRAWYGDTKRDTHCPNCGGDIASLAHTLFNLGFDSGARWAIRRTMELSPHIAKFVELMTWLCVQDKDMVRTLKRIVLGEIID